MGKPKPADRGAAQSRARTCGRPETNEWQAHLNDKPPATAPQSDFDVVVEDERWTAELGDARALARSCLEAAAALEPRVAGAPALLLADDAALQELNRRFRGFDKPTNVLSFPAAAGSGFLGDIAIAFDTCRREADEFGIAFRDHVQHLIVHGILHLVGHDHETDEEADRMERLESRILASLDVADPYAQENAGGPGERD